MPVALTEPHSPLPLRSRGFQMPQATPRPTCCAADEAIEEMPSSRGFSALLAAYRSSGGTARGDDVARLLEDHGLLDFIGLARLVASRKVFGFEWRNTLWIPMFQFDLEDLSVRPSARLVLAELGDEFDDWGRAAWFAQPHHGLQHRRPVDLMQSDLPEVLNAARVSRYVAVG